MQKETINSDGEMEYFPVYARLVMDNENDTVNVGGNFITRSNYYLSYSSNIPHLLSTGTLSIGGDIYDWDYDIQASDTHKIVLNGTEKQTVYFDKSYSFNILELTQPFSNYTFPLL